MQSLSIHPTHFYHAIACIMTSMEAVVKHADGSFDIDTERKFKLVMDQTDLRITGTGADAFTLLAAGLKNGMFPAKDYPDTHKFIDGLVATVQAEMNCDELDDEDISYELVIDGALFSFRAETPTNIFGIKHTFG